MQTKITYTVIITYDPENVIAPTASGVRWAISDTFSDAFGVGLAVSVSLDSITPAD